MNAEHSASSLASSTASTTILVVEDEILVRAVVSDELRDAGYTVIEAANGDEAIELLRSPVRVDIVITDLQMPGSINGAGLVRSIHAQWPHLRVVMMSAQAADQDIHELLDGYVSKPFIPRNLVEYVRALPDRTRASLPS